MAKSLCDRTFQSEEPPAPSPAQTSLETAAGPRSEATLHFILEFLNPMFALVGGSVSLMAAFYTKRSQNRLQRVASEVAKRETVYGDFLMSASKLFLTAHVQDEIALGGEEHQLLGLVNRMRLFAPSEVVGCAEAAARAIFDILLNPDIEPRQLAKEALSKGLDPDPLLLFSSICRADLDHVRRTLA